MDHTEYADAILKWVRLKTPDQHTIDKWLRLKSIEWIAAAILLATKELNTDEQRTNEAPTSRR